MLLAETLEATQRSHAEGASRDAERGVDAPPIATEFAMMYFRHDDTN
jgi:hypothetical protein